MKKLIIAAGAALIGIVVNAASFSWSTTGSVYSPSDSTVALNGFTAYLLSTSTITQSGLVAALRDGGSISDYSVLSTYTAASDSSKVTASGAGFEATGTQSAFFAIIRDDYVYISKVVTKDALDVGTANLAFASQSTSSATVFASTAEFSTPGWYQTVPEPTSGLLMLLGMAGLALRRRRA